MNPLRHRVHLGVDLAALLLGQHLAVDLAGVRAVVPDVGVGIAAVGGGEDPGHPR